MNRNTKSPLLDAGVMPLFPGVHQFVLRSHVAALRVRRRLALAVSLAALGTWTLPVVAQSDLATVRLRAEQGDPEALNVLGNIYSHGQGVTADPAEALRLYQRAAERGFGAAHFNVGMAYELGRGVPADLSAAFNAYRKAAEAGFAPAQFNVGNMYANGIGVAQDLFEAALWFRRGAEAGVTEAQYNLGIAYELGRGVAKDEVAAQKWYRMAAAQNYARANYNLAIMLEEGRGSPVDLAGAEQLYRRAALQNYAPAQNNLGILLTEGRGSPPDLLQAYAWLALAAENGLKPIGRDAVAQQFTAAQLAEANGMVAKLRAQLSAGAPAAPSATAPSIVGAPPARTTSEGPAPSPAGGDPELKKRLAATESDLAELLIEYNRLTGVAQGLARAKTAIEQQLTVAAAASPAATAPAPAAPSADVTAKLVRLQDALDDARSENARLTAALESSQRDRATFESRLTASAQLLERERTTFQGRLAAAESRAVTDRAAATATTFPDPAVEPLRAQVAQLTRDMAALRTEKEQLQAQLADVTSQLATARAVSAPAAMAAGRATAANAESPAGGSSDARVAKLIADNNRLNDEVRRSIVQLAALNRQLRAAQDKAAAAGGGTPSEPTASSAGNAKSP